MVIDDVFDNIKIHLELDTHVTVITGESGKGKTLVFKVLDKFYDGKAVHKYTYQTEFSGLVADIQKSTNCLFVIDRIELILDDNVKEAILADKSNMFLLLGREYHGLGTEPGSIKVLDFTNGTLSTVTIR